MCGIAGIFFAHGQHGGPQLTAFAQGMGDALSTRGPDDHGVWVDETAGIAIAHRRLSILDLSPEGHQPMVSASGRYVLSYNGEIYNYRELRAQLNYAWRGSSDTEIILAAIEQWGIEKALNEFNGMFAFALWDREAQTLTLARDRMGEKPLYYGYVGDAFVFGSELKALRTVPGFAATINREALALLMRYSYIPAPHAIYERIHKLPPAHYLTLKAGEQPQPKPYWSLAAMVATSTANRFRGSEADAIDQLDATLKHAVGQRMMSDVPLGAFLSGGIDSSLVVALMQAQSARPVQSFTIGFEERGLNEAPYAKAVAQHLGTDHHELYVTGREALELVSHLPTMYDEPFADSSQIPTYLVSHFARQHVTVALSGDGGDELFGGYRRHIRGPLLWKLLSAFPSALRRHLPYSAATAEEFYDRICATSHTPLVLGATSPTLTPHAATLPFAEWMMLQDALTYFPGDILTKLDRASMAVSLEARTPFTDIDVMALAWQLPLSMKIQRGHGKHVLRELLYRYVPRRLIDRQKAGFAVPLDGWLRGPLRDWAADLLDPNTLRHQAYLDADAVQALWQAHQSGSNNGKALWNVLMFQSWLAKQTN